MTRLRLAPGVIADVFLFDPVTIAAIGTGVSALFGGASLAKQLLTPTPSAPTMPAPAPPVQSPQGSQTSNAPQQGPSFLAAAAAPSGNQAAGGKSLLGQ